MTMISRRIAVAVLFGLTLVYSDVVHAEEWTPPVEVTYDQKPCLSYRARLGGSFIVVEARIHAGWHTFAMDNARRAAEKLAGRKALSQDQPTEISITRGLEVIGPWFQSSPKDFSRPELRWYSWGFENGAFFAAKIKRTGAGPAHIAIRGQVCTETVCRKIDIVISLALPPGKRPDTPDADLQDLIQVH